MRAVERAGWSALLDAYAKGGIDEPVVLTLDGKAVATVLPVEEADLESITVGTSQAFQQLIKRSRVRHEAEGGIELHVLRRELSGG